MNAPIQQNRLDLSTFPDDIERCARAIGARFSRPMIDRVIAKFREHLLDPEGFVWWKTTTLPGSPLSYRFLRGNYPEGTDLVQEARELGAWAETERSHPEIFGLCANLFRSHARAAKWMGNDFHADSGPSKVYMWLGTELRLRDLDRSGFPPGLAGQISLLEGVGLDQVRIVGVDYQKASVNLYMYDAPDVFTAPTIRTLLDRTFPGSADPRVIDEIVGSLWGPPVGLALTFSWKTGELDRWCIYSHGLPHSTPEMLPPGFRLPPLPERFQQLDAAAGPGYLPFPLHDISWVFGRPTFHMKYDRTHFGSPWNIGKYFGMPPSAEEALKRGDGAGHS